MIAEPTAQRPPRDTGAVEAMDAENPWPGLSAFREADRDLFHGRETEADELARLVLRERVSVLYGLSGLGKTSLLQAGLFPRLRRENILPVYLRLDVSGRGPSPADQIREAVTAAARAADVEAPAFQGGDTLWESFHRQGADFWSPRNRPVTPLLVLDQFEEIFTLGRRDRAASEQTTALLIDLASLSEGAPPDSVRSRLDAEPSAAAGYSFGRHAYKLLFSLREDFLPELEGLRHRIRAILLNRYRLQPMNGLQALDVIAKAGGHLVEPGVAEHIVRFVAAEEEAESPLSGLETEPALLSVVCRELNNERRRRGLPRITAALLHGSREEILTDFYERSLADQLPEMRTFLEEHLLTKSGFRDSVALDNALALPGVDAEAIRTLTDRRLLRVEDRGGMQRVELTHDVLAGVVRRSRDARREKEERARLEAAREEAEERERRARRKLRRSWLITALLSLLLSGVVVLAWRASAAEGKAHKALARANREKGLNAWHGGDAAEALAHFAQAVRLDPAELTGRTWLMSLLLRQDWTLPLRDLAQGKESTYLRGLRVSPDGRFVLTLYRDEPARLFAVRTGQEIRLAGSPVSQEAYFSPDGRLLVTSNEKTLTVWSTETGRSLVQSLPSGYFHGFSPDGRWMFLSGFSTFKILESATGREVFSRDGDLGGVSPTGKEITLLSGPSVLAMSLEDRSIRPVGKVDAPALIPIDRPEGGDLLVLLARRDKEQERTFGILKADSARLHLLPAGTEWRRLGPGSSSVFGEREADQSFIFQDLARPDAPPLLLGRFDWDKTLEVSPEGLILFFDRGTLRIWDSRTRRDFCQRLSGIADAHFVPGQPALVTGSRDGTVRLWSLRTGHAVPDLVQLPLLAKPLHAEALHAGDQEVMVAATGTEDEDKQEMSLFTLQGRRVIPGKKIRLSTSPPGFPVFSPDGTLLAIPEREALTLWNPRTGTLQGSFPLKSFLFNSLAFTADGRSVAAAEGRTLRVWSLESGKKIPERTLTLPGDLAATALSADGRRAATVSEDAPTVIRLWDLVSHRVLTTFHGFPDVGGVPQVASIALRPDGESLLAVHRGGLVSRLRLSTGKRIDRAGPEQGFISGAIVFSPDGQIAVTSGEHTVSFRSVETGQPLEALEMGIPPEAGMFVTAFRPRGDQVFLGAEHGVLIVDMPGLYGEPEDLLRLAEAVAGRAVADDGSLVPVTDALRVLGSLRRETAGAPPGSPEPASLIRWFLADPWRRTVSPLSEKTVQPADIDTPGPGT